MRRIPQEIKDKISDSPFYKKCCVSFLGDCSGRIEIHHNLIYAGNQCDELWTLLPVCHYHHAHEKDKELKDRLNYIMLLRATDQELLDKSKAINYINERARLKLKYDKI